MSPSPHEPWPTPAPGSSPGSSGGKSGGQHAAHPPTRAAVFLWIVGGIETAVFTCLASCLGFMAVVPDNIWEQAMAQQPDPAVAEAMSRGQLMPQALLLFVLGVVPGVAYIILGFFVRKGRAGAINLALLIGITQLVVIGINFLASAGHFIMTGNLMFVTLIVLTQGTLLALLVAALRWLLKAKTYTSDNLGQETDPWSEKDPW